MKKGGRMCKHPDVANETAIAELNEMGFGITSDTATLDVSSPLDWWIYPSKVRYVEWN